MNEQNKILKIQMKEFGTDLFYRNSVGGIFDSIIEKNDLAQFDLIVIDFFGVTSVSSGFGFDFFYKLRNHLGQDFLKKIRVSFDQNSSSKNIEVVLGEAFKKL